MSVVRIRPHLWDQVHGYLTERPERFAFFFARWSMSRDEPMFVVIDQYLVPEDRVEYGHDGYAVDPEVLISCVNQAVRTGTCLLEAHSHGGPVPRFSQRIDRPGLLETSQYVLSSLPGRPYGAFVWGASRAYGEYWTAEGQTGTIRSLVVAGPAGIWQRVSRDDDDTGPEDRFARQVPWFSPEGQQSIRRLRVGILGVGGTGSHVANQLAYLGSRDFAVIDPDTAETTNMNRLVTAMDADLGTPKVVLARRTIRSIAPDAQVDILERSFLTPEALDVARGCDVLFSCFDDDGPRLVAAELALAYDIPLIDLGVGIGVDDGRVVEAGGRVVTFLPEGPCLQCVGQIDHVEAGRYLKPARDRAVDRERGYIPGVENPAVVSLNGSVASMAVNEYAVAVSHVRYAQPHLELDLLGAGRKLASQWVTPVRAAVDRDCALCPIALAGDGANIERHHEAREDAVEGTRSRRRVSSLPPRNTTRC